MRLVLTGRHVEITPALRALVDRKLGKLRRVLNESVVSAQVVLARERHRHLAEITLHARGDHVLHGLGIAGAWETSLAEAVEKLRQQGDRLKGKWQERKRHALPVKALAEGLPPRRRRPAAPESALPGLDGRPRVIPVPRYAVKPMSVEEAALAIADPGARETFLVFRNAATDAINVVYRRRDGNVGLIEPEA